MTDTTKTKAPKELRDLRRRAKALSERSTELRTELKKLGEERKAVKEELVALRSRLGLETKTRTANDPKADKKK